eukprot:gene7472-53844_t
MSVSAAALACSLCGEGPHDCECEDGEGECPAPAAKRGRCDGGDPDKFFGSIGRVRVTGLQSAKSLNGQIGRIIQHRAGSDTARVFFAQLLNSKKSDTLRRNVPEAARDIRCQCLQLVDPEPSLLHL